MVEHTCDLDVELRELGAQFQNWLHSELKAAWDVG